MFIVTLRFATHKAQAGPLMGAHAEWLQRGFDDGVFVLAGSLVPGLGGAIVAQGTTLAALQQRVGRDPFVAHGVVHAEILEIEPSKADHRLQFLLGR